MKKGRFNNGIMVVKEKNEGIESLIRRFKKKVGKSGILQELKGRSFFEKPSDKKRRKRRESIRKIKRQEMINNSINRRNEK